MALLSERKLWNVYARVYDGLLDFVPYQRLLSETVDELQLTPNAHIADLGCGTGNITTAVLQAEPDLTVDAVDLSEAMIKRARKRHGADRRVRLHHQDLLEWMSQQDEATFDFIVSVNVIYVFNADQRAEFFQQLRRILRPTGRAVIVTSDREGFGPVMREQFRAKGVLRSLTPRLISVLVMNLFIWMKESNDQFDPASQSTLEEELATAQLNALNVERCYGGAEEGVNVRFTIEPVVDIRPVANLEIVLDSQDDAESTQLDNPAHPSTQAINSEAEPSAPVESHRRSS